MSKLDVNPLVVLAGISLGILLATFILPPPVSATPVEIEPDVPHRSSFPTGLPEVDSVPAGGLPPMASGVVLVGLEPHVTVSASLRGIQTNDASLSHTLMRVGARSVEPLFAGADGCAPTLSTRAGADLSRVYRLHLAPDADVLSAVAALNADPAVVYAEPDYLAHSITTPNDPLYADQWSLTTIDAPAAWDVVTGTNGVVIAVIDAGLDISHADLSGQLWTNPGEIAGNGLDDDNNGYVDDVHGWNFVDDNADLSDNTGHGTQVAGAIGATTNNGAGIAGLCWGCRLMVVKVTQPGGAANYSDIAAGVAYAAQKGADVINLSLGGYSDSATLRAAIEAAAETAVVVGGAGNDDDSAPFYPAAYDDHVLAVAGTTMTDTKSATSNYGPWIDVSAPGAAITTTFDGGGYGATSGTSMAAPFGAGLAGLLLSHHPAWSPDLVRAQIIHTAEAIDGLNPTYAGELGSGRIDAGWAVTTTAQPLLSYQDHAVDGESGGRPDPGTTVDLGVTLYNDWAGATNVGATLTTGDPLVTVTLGTTAYGDIGVYESGANGTPFEIEIADAAPYAHDIPFTLSITADGGYTATLPFTVTTSPGIETVQGTLTTTTWTNDRIYVVTNNAGLEAGHVLTIEAGTVVTFAGSYSLSINGTLIADGTADQPIHFRSAGEWGKIQFTDTSVDAAFDGDGNYTGGSIVRHAAFEYGGIDVQQSAPYLADNALDQASIIGTASAGMMVVDNRLDSGRISLSLPDGGTVEGNTVADGQLTVSASTGATIAGNMLTSAPLTVFGPSIVAGNTVTETGTWGIVVSEVLTVTANRVISCETGLFGYADFVSGNLLAHNARYGAELGESTEFVSNTVLHNGEAGFYVSGGTPVIHHNNLLAGEGAYGLYNATASPITATHNWWGVTGGEIETVIYDDADDALVGAVDHGSYLSGPEQSAPAYVTDVTLNPASPVGIETVTFDVAFSRPMDHGLDPTTRFYSTRWGTWTAYDTNDSGLPDNDVFAVAVDDNGEKWFGTLGGGLARFDGSVWTVYTSNNSGLPSDEIRDIAIEDDGTIWIGGGNEPASFDGSTWQTHGAPIVDCWAVAIGDDGTKWFGTEHQGAASFDGSNWTVYRASNTDLPHDHVASVAVDIDGSIWLGTFGGGVANFDGSNWTVYNSTNSGLPSDYVLSIAIEDDGDKWFGTGGGGAAHFDGSDWTVYVTGNPDMYFGHITAIAIDSDGTKWFGSYEGGAASFDDRIWTVYTTDFSSLPSGRMITGIAIDDDGAVWFSKNYSGVHVKWGGDVYPIVDGAQWLDATHWRASYDVNALVPRDDYVVDVRGAVGGDGVEIVPAVSYTFTVDYAGGVTDQTPPEAPSVSAQGDRDDPTTVAASWSASDPDSEITLYRYAIGTAPGGIDVVNWTETTALSMTRSGLGLMEGVIYHVSVRARNTGGLWSDHGDDWFFAGAPPNGVFLPLVLRD